MFQRLLVIHLFNTDANEKENVIDSSQAGSLKNDIPFSLLVMMLLQACWPVRNKMLLVSCSVK